MRPGSILCSSLFELFPKDTNSLPVLLFPSKGPFLSHPHHSRLTFNLFFATLVRCLSWLPSPAVSPHHLAQVCLSPLSSLTLLFISYLLHCIINSLCVCWGGGGESEGHGGEGSWHIMECTEMFCVAPQARISTELPKKQRW